MANQTTVNIPEPLLTRAKFFRINVSAVCRAAVADVVTQMEKETRAAVTTTHGPEQSPRKEVAQ